MDNAQTNSSNWILNFITNKRWAFFRHLLLILVIAADFSLLSPSELAMHAEKVGVTFRVFYVGQFFNMLFAVGAVYFSLYYLFPSFLKKGKYIQYVAFIGLIGVTFFLVNYFTQQIYVQYFGKFPEFAMKFTFADFIANFAYPMAFIGGTTGYKIFKTWVSDQQRFAELQKENLNTELAQLKNQVNPHFLFNTLNNLHVLTMTNPEKASEIILGLSDVLRYQIYDSQNDKVLLSKDIEIIRQYLDLEKIRRDSLQIFLTVDGTASNVSVPPLLFINFIDNAIKHSNTRGESSINIVFLIKNDRLFFEISNSKSLVKSNLEESNGFGLVNVKKRLNLLYGSEHNLEIADEETRFHVKLNFPL
jgi:Histidine kinase/GHKL domain